MFTTYLSFAKGLEESDEGATVFRRSKNDNDRDRLTGSDAIIGLEISLLSNTRWLGMISFYVFKKREKFFKYFHLKVIFG